MFERMPKSREVKPPSLNKFHTDSLSQLIERTREENMCEVLRITSTLGLEIGYIRKLKYADDVFNQVLYLMRQKALAGNIEYELMLNALRDDLAAWDKGAKKHNLHKEYCDFYNEGRNLYFEVTMAIAELNILKRTPESMKEGSQQIRDAVSNFREMFIWPDFGFGGGLVAGIFLEASELESDPKRKNGFEEIAYYLSGCGYPFTLNRRIEECFGIRRLY